MKDRLAAVSCVHVVIVMSERYVYTPENMYPAQTVCVPAAVVVADIRRQRVDKYFTKPAGKDKYVVIRL